ncbi:MULTISPECIES: sigma-54-dependent transcriptional regulator [unclassified Mucilaginibacter]|uniref:sigma-54-dependent transcriptional regulator n=1 Tax=unclassified Mucilaginibacter TaxID=2617802 RepID=UPI000965837E|nr:MULTISPECIES: sigma-54 dependent transcriptional regulator [unclassified Mucilaginibacter]OJW17352.1 MAG: sigma-54-dependent Fis family transcriptional regulator [Mucilaginibacter sp. 44-25]PLW91448.1 MAG: sigma-54-dependent Fis family transcriptional regulator [Mucilaginibacter sp.]HEK18819.1 sigma-54-dependent Fis family transcriptional regulator [Bacteroidota bacterium]
MKKILIIDDEVNVGLLLSKFLTRNGFEITTAANGSAGMECLKKEEYDLVLCDFRLEDTDGREMLKNIKALYPKTGVIIITGYSDIKMAVELIKMGAYDYITKPLYPDEILNTINKAIETQYALQESGGSDYGSTKPAGLKENKKQVLTAEFVVGTSKASKELYRQIELVAPTNYSVIILGESGTGKESVAKSIHMNSPRANEPFVAMDCGSLTKELAASEFFGHEKGSFTGALYTKIGHFEMANGGTLFLDEVGNLSYEIQAALLRTVQERKVKRIGSTKEIDLDVRIIIATNENLQDGINKGRFREDLYHRFNEFSIFMPPLRERGNDIMMLAEHFLKVANQELDRSVTSFSPDVVECFMNYRWQGNIRELKNVVRRATLLTEGNEITMKTLPLEISNYRVSAFESSPSAANNEQKEAKHDLKNAALGAEHETILRVLREVNFNKTKAAEILNIDRKTLYNKMKAINLK